MLLNVILKNVGPVKSKLHVSKKKPVSIGLNYLQVGKMLVESLETEAGQLFVIAGKEITKSVLMRIKNWVKLYRIKEPIIVYKNLYYIKELNIKISFPLVRF